MEKDKNPYAGHSSKRKTVQEDLKSSPMMQSILQGGGNTQQLPPPNPPYPTEKNDPFAIEVEVPSRGVLSSSKHQDGRVIIHPLRGQHQDALTSMGEGGNAGPMLRRITSMVIELPPGFFFQEMLASDWVFCLLNILGITFPYGISISPKCPKCGLEVRHNFTIGDLPCTYPEDIDTGEGTDEEGKYFKVPYKEPFTVGPLTASKATVQYRLLRVKDLENIDNVRADNEKRHPNLKVNMSNFALSQYIQKIDGKEVSSQDALLWLDKLLLCDIAEIKQDISMVETGYDVEPQLLCSNKDSGGQECGNKFLFQIPVMSAGFFRQFAPKTRRNKKTKVPINAPR